MKNENRTQSSNHKATFKYRYLSGHDNEFVVLVYEYRGHEYSIFENTARGYGESLRSQHIQEQRRIDDIIEDRNGPRKPVREEDTAKYAMDRFIDYINGDEHAFD